MRSIVVILDNEYKPDPRVKKHIDCLLNDLNFKVHLICTESKEKEKDDNHPNLKIYRMMNQLHLFQFYKHRFEKELDFIEKIIRNNNITNILVNDHICLEIGCKLQRKINDLRIIYDAHEFISGWPYYQYEKRWLNYIKGALVHKFFSYKEKRNLKKVYSLITVSEGIRNEYLKIQPFRDSTVIRNIPPWSDQNLDASKDYFEKLGLDENQKILIHSGNLYYKDHILDFLLNNILEFKEDWRILFLIKNSDRYKITNHRLYKHIQDKILFHDFVPYHELKNLLSVGTAGLILNYKPEWKSHWLSLPNRIFDYIHADLPIISTKQPEFEKIVNTFDIGVTFDITQDTNTVMLGFQKIIENELHFKKKLNGAQREMMWSEEKKRFIAVVKNFNYD